MRFEQHGEGHLPKTGGGSQGGCISGGGATRHREQPVQRPNLLLFGRMNWTQPENAPAAHEAGKEPGPPVSTGRWRPGAPPPSRYQQTSPFCLPEGQRQQGFLPVNHEKLAVVAQQLFSQNRDRMKTPEARAGSPGDYFWFPEKGHCCLFLYHLYFWMGGGMRLSLVGWWVVFF